MYTRTSLCVFHYIVVSILLIPLEAGARPPTLLHDTARIGKESQLEELLHAGADPNALDGEGRTPLYVACVEGNVKAVEILLKAKADTTIAAAIRDRTPLHAAAYHGREDIIKTLLAAGVPVDIRTSKAQHTPLHFAARHGLVDSVEVLLNAGADPNAMDYRGQTPLFFEIHMRDVIAAKHDNAPQPARPSPEQTLEGNAKIARLLVEHGGKVNVTAQFPKGLTPLHSAVKTQNSLVLQYLLDQGADSSAILEGSGTPLEIAERVENAEAIKILKTPRPATRPATMPAR